MDNKISILIIILVLVVTGLIVGRVQQARKSPVEIEAENSDRGIPVKVAKVSKDEISK
ncbi:hypothetical protein [Halanaerobaculum tunisiense]